MQNKIQYTVNLDCRHLQLDHSITKILPEKVKNCVSMLQRTVEMEMMCIPHGIRHTLIAGMCQHSTFIQDVSVQVSIRMIRHGIFYKVSKLT